MFWMCSFGSGLHPGLITVFTSTQMNRTRGENKPELHSTEPNKAGVKTSQVLVWIFSFLILGFFLNLNQLILLKLAFCFVILASWCFACCNPNSTNWPNVDPADYCFLEELNCSASLAWWLKDYYYYSYCLGVGLFVPLQSIRQLKNWTGNRGEREGMTCSKGPQG